MNLRDTMISKLTGIRHKSAQESEMLATLERDKRAVEALRAFADSIEVETIEVDYWRHRADENRQFWHHLANLIDRGNLKVARSIVRDMFQHERNQIPEAAWGSLDCFDFGEVDGKPGLHVKQWKR